ncbi:unnamed protein product [Ambrosiozyma monospora]|uniref:RNA polymerase II transcription factor B subunit 3 n=1 Tax=Ambrosiozyma monospora TaxID=43982 RepID=A0A9W6Z3J9_AMBMO|nr:unnamed protein product [Ambrosiozyma monospora]
MILMMIKLIFDYSSDSFQIHHKAKTHIILPTMSELDWSNIPKDLCPVCKTDKYLSPEIQFKINPECYHKMCDSCVDRLFSLGPSECPYPNCSKILRKNRFKTQVFADIEVEKECDVRKRVLNVYNKTEKDLDSLDLYNQYLEEIEEIVYNLTNKIDVEATNERLEEYSIINKQSIQLNNSRKDQEYETHIKIKKLKRQLKIDKKRLVEELKEAQDKLKKEKEQATIDQLQNAASQNANDIIKKVEESGPNLEEEFEKKISELEKNYEIQKEAIIKGDDLLVKKEKDIPAIPFTPFNGDRMLKLPYKLDVDTYRDPFYLKMVKDVQYTASGYKIEMFFERSLNDAFTGLDCSIQEEKMPAF